jgi:NAD kinase
MNKKGLPPRAVVVTRPTDYEALLLRHGTKAQAAFFLESRGQKIGEVIDRHALQVQALHAVTAAIPTHWRRATIARADLDRFLFEPEDLILAVGQDGLVANVAKYLSGQRVIGFNPSKKLNPGVLVRHAPEATADLLSAFEGGRLKVEARAMVQAELADGTRLVALNEVFVGHRSHQSARYALSFGTKVEHQSSSGLLVATGTGCTGWAKSVSLRRTGCPPLPGPTSLSLVFLVREAWPSVGYGAELVHGVLDDAALTIASEMNEGGVCFGDGIESDHLDLPFGQTLTISRAPTPLALVA